MTIGKHLRAIVFFAVLLVPLLMLTGCPDLLGTLDDSRTTDDTETSSALAAPTNVRTASDSASGTIRVTWDSVSGADSYRVQYKTDSDLAWSSTNVAATSYSHAVSAGVRVYFRVVAVRGTELSSASAQVSAIIDLVHTLAVDLQSAYFSDLGTSTLEVYVNESSTPSATIGAGDVQAGEWHQEIVQFEGLLESIRFVSGSYSTLFDELSDFASGSAQLTDLFEIEKVVLYPYYNMFSSTYTGTGAYIGPKQPWTFDFALGNVTDASITVTLDASGVDENTTNLAFDVYVSATDAETTIDGYTAADISSYTIVGDDVSAADLAAGYAVTELSPSTEYFVAIVGVYEGVEGIASMSNSATTAASSLPSSGTSSDPILLTVGAAELYEATIDSDNGVWFAFPAAAGESYAVTWSDSFEGTVDHTVDVMASIYHQDKSTAYVSAKDSAYDTPYELTVASGDSQVFIHVEPYFTGDSGTFGIKVADAAVVSLSRTQIASDELSVTAGSEGSDPFATSTSAGYVYATWSEDDPNSTSYADWDLFYSRYDGSSWANPTKLADLYYPSRATLVPDGADSVYAVYLRYESYREYVTVDSISGTSVTNVPVGVSDPEASAVDAAGFGTTLYVAHSEGGVVTVQSYDGSGWTDLGFANDGDSAASPHLGVDDGGEVYVLFTDTDAVDSSVTGMTVRRYASGAWTVHGSRRFDDDELSYRSISGGAAGTVYVAYSQDDGTYTSGPATVKALTASTVADVGTNPVLAAESYDIAIQAVGSVLYLATSTESMYKYANFWTLDTAASSPSWSIVDGTANELKGICVHVALGADGRVFHAFADRTAPTSASYYNPSIFAYE